MQIQYEVEGKAKYQFFFLYSCFNASFMLRFYFTYFKEVHTLFASASAYAS